MKTLFVLFLSNFLLISAFCQETIDVIYLKNNNIYRGTIIEQNKNEIRLKTLCQNELVFPFLEIEKIEKEPFNTFEELSNKGYFNFTSFGVLVGSSANTRPAPLTITMDNNYRLNKSLAAGFSVGIDKLNETTFPVSLNSKYFVPLKKGTTLFLNLNYGYSISLEKPEIDSYYNTKEANGGVLFNGDVGFVFASGNNASLFMSLGYRYNVLNYKLEEWYYGEVNRTLYYNRLVIKIGVLLH